MVRARAEQIEGPVTEIGVAPPPLPPLPTRPSGGG
jgi:hypothetical protein